MDFAAEDHQDIRVEPYKMILQAMGDLFQNVYPPHDTGRFTPEDYAYLHGIKDSAYRVINSATVEDRETLLTYWREVTER